MVTTNYMWLLNYKFQLSKIKIQFLSHTNHILNVQYPYVAHSYNIR